MDYKFIISQVFGFLALLFLYFSFNKNNKHTLLLNHSMSNLMFALSFLFLGAYTGFFSFLMASFRNLIFNKYNEVPSYIVILVIVVMVFLSLLSYNGLYSLLPVIGIIIYTYSLGKKNKKKNLKEMRFAELTASILCVIYDYIVKAYTGLLTNFVEAVIVLIAINRYDIKKKKMSS